MKKTERAKTIYRQDPGLWLAALCYACGFLLLLAVHFGGFAANRLAYRSGALAEAELTLADFDTQDLIEVDGALVSTGADPQLLLRDNTRRVENVVLEAAYSLPPLTLTAYWAPPGQDYSVRRMAFSPAAQENTARFLLPAAGGQSLRIDPGAVAGSTITIRRILINQKRPFLDFFRLSAGEGILLAVAPGLVACGLSLVLGHFPRKKTPAEGDPEAGPPQNKGPGESTPGGEDAPAEAGEKGGARA